MLGTVAFDGLSRSTWWLDRVYDIQSSISDPAMADRVIMLLNLSGLILTVLFVAGVYTGAVKIAERIAGESFSGVFVFSLVPIAFVYALAHYFSLLVVQGQFAIPLASDPYGKGWDLIGTDDFQPKLDVLSPNATWYVAVGALVLGHVCGLVVGPRPSGGRVPVASRGRADAVRDAGSHDPLHDRRHVAPLDRIT